METDFKEMREEFRELQVGIEAARSKLFSAQDALHKAHSDVYAAMCDVARLEQKRIYAMSEMAKAANSR